MVQHLDPPFEDVLRCAWRAQPAVAPPPGRVTLAEAWYDIMMSLRTPRSPVSRAALLALSATAALSLISLFGPRPARAEPQRVAVLPFKALASGKAQKEWIGAGLAEALTAALATIPALRVVERAQLRALQTELARADLADNDEGAVKIGKLLQANRLVLGSFQLAGGEILINGRFVSTQTGAIGQTFQLRGREGALFDLYPKLTTQVLGLLGQSARGRSLEALAAVQVAPQSESAEALYVRAREEQNSRTAEGYRRAIDLFTQATREDPSFAQAYAALGQAQAELVGLQCASLRFFERFRGDEGCHLPGRDSGMNELAQRLGFADLDAAFASGDQKAQGLKKECARLLQAAQASANTAVSLSPALPAAHRALALTLWHRGQRQPAEVEARTLLNLNPSDAFGSYLLGLTSTDAEESRGFHQRSLEIDPLLLENYLELAVWSYDASTAPGDEKEVEAAALLRKGLALPASETARAPLRQLLGELLLRKGDARAALQQADLVIAQQAEHPRAHFVRALALWQLGGPARPYVAREAWQDAAALSLLRARLWEAPVCHEQHRLAHPVSVFNVTLPPRLRRGVWPAWHKQLDALMRHVYQHGHDLEDPSDKHCAGQRAGQVVFLDTQNQSKPVTRWDREILMSQAAPEVIDNWWRDRSWNQFVFAVAVCAGAAVSPDDEVRAELLFDGKPQGAFFPLGADGRESEEWMGSDKAVELVGAPRPATRVRQSFSLRGRALLEPLRPVLQDGSEHHLTLRVRRGRKTLAEGQIPLRMLDTNRPRASDKP